jgi:hypothetical protein
MCSNVEQTHPVATARYHVYMDAQIIIRVRSGRPSTDLLPPSSKP